MCDVKPHDRIRIADFFLRARAEVTVEIVRTGARAGSA